MYHQSMKNHVRMERISEHPALTIPIQQLFSTSSNCIKKLEPILMKREKLSTLFVNGSVGLFYVHPALKLGKVISS